MRKMYIAAGFVAGVFDGFGWLRARDWLCDRITWTGPAIDAFDKSSDWFCIRAGLMARTRDDD